MQSTNSLTPSDLDWWWPSPESFDALTVTETDEGWELSAPDETELGIWLSYWSETKERHTLFQSMFVQALEKHAHTVIDDLENHGKNENLPDGRDPDSEQA